MREAIRNQKKADYNPGLSPSKHPENKVNIANLLKTCLGFQISRLRGRRFFKAALTQPLEIWSYSLGAGPWRRSNQ